jgi:hypothetical protein
MTFRVGEKVVCVDGNFGESWNVAGALLRPIAGMTYIVRWVGDWNFCDGTALSLRLMEIENPAKNWLLNGVSEAAFVTSRFRPFVPRKTEISFTHGADPSSDQFDNRLVKVGASA